MKTFEKVKTGYENTKCILRGYYSGVFYGVIEEVEIYEGIQKFKIRGRVLYRWKSIKGICINSLAEYGIELNSDTKIENESVFYCFDINQIIPCSDEAIRIFDSIKNNFNR